MLHPQKKIFKWFLTNNPILDTRISILKGEQLKTHQKNKICCCCCKISLFTSKTKLWSLLVKDKRNIHYTCPLNIKFPFNWFKHSLRAGFMCYPIKNERKIIININCFSLEIKYETQGFSSRLLLSQ